MNDLGYALRNELRAERDALIGAFCAGGAVRTLLHGLSNSTDRLLRRVIRSRALQDHAAVIAVGGYGRGALFPHSDVDILILHDEQLDAAQSAQIEGLIGQLWDLGLQVGHSVRTVEECREEARRDVTVLTSMLESRLVIGRHSNGGCAPPARGSAWRRRRPCAAVTKPGATDSGPIGC